MNTSVVYRALTIGRDGSLINRESQNLTTFIKLNEGKICKKSFVKEVSRIIITYNNKGIPVNSTCSKIA